MIATATRTVAASGGALAQPASERVGVADVVEAQLGDDPLPLRPSGHFVADRFLERVGDVPKGGDRVGVSGCSARPCLWLASQPNPLLGFADRPATAGGVAGEAAADVVAGGAEQGLAVPLAEVAGLEQLQGVVR